MTYYSEAELTDIGFKKIGRNVKISKNSAIYYPEKMEIGNNCRVDDFCLLSGKINLGDNIHIAAYSHIAAGDSGVYLNDFSGLAFGCHLFTSSDDYTGLALTNPTVPEEYRLLKKGPIILERHVIIGAKSMIFPDIIVSEGCALGAMSLLTKSTKPWGIYFGIPAKRIKERKKNLLDLERKYLESMSQETVN